jgi:hypothetical protein
MHPLQTGIFAPLGKLGGWMKRTLAGSALEGNDGKVAVREVIGRC